MTKQSTEHGPDVFLVISWVIDEISSAAAAFHQRITVSETRRPPKFMSSYQGNTGSFAIVQYHHTSDHLAELGDGEISIFPWLLD